MKLIPVLLLAFFVGCAGRNFDMDKIDRVRTQHEALEMLGKPRSKAKVAGTGHETWGYSFGTPFGAKAAFITFDKNGDVVSHSSSK